MKSSASWFADVLLPTCGQVQGTGVSAAAHMRDAFGTAALLAVDPAPPPRGAPV